LTIETVATTITGPALAVVINQQPEQGQLQQQESQPQNGEQLPAQPHGYGVALEPSQRPRYDAPPIAENPQLRTLFLSPISVIERTLSREIGQTALERGIHFYNCSRSHIFSEFSGDDEALPPRTATFFDARECLLHAAIERLKAALLLAEKEGRVVYLWDLPVPAATTSDEAIEAASANAKTFSALNKLLTTNGYAPLQIPPARSTGAAPTYSPFLVRHLAELQLPTLRLFF
jgi:hypothetical protein